MGSISILSRAELGPAQDEEAAAVPWLKLLGVGLAAGSVEIGDDASAERTAAALEVAIGGKGGREGREVEGAEDDFVEVGILCVSRDQKGRHDDSRSSQACLTGPSWPAPSSTRPSSGKVHNRDKLSQKVRVPVLWSM